MLRLLARPSARLAAAAAGSSLLAATQVECDRRTGRLEGRSTIVTGAASGMGAASAKLFAAEGAKVAVVDVNAAGAEAVAAEIRAAGGGAIVCTSSISAVFATPGEALGF